MDKVLAWRKPSDWYFEETDEEQTLGQVRLRVWGLVRFYGFLLWCDQDQKRDTLYRTLIGEAGAGQDED